VAAQLHPATATSYRLEHDALLCGIEGIAERESNPPPRGLSEDS
jgi:hypothetical protein